MRASVIIVTAGRPHLLEDTLRSLEACRPAPHQVVVVDGDTQGTARGPTERHASSVVYEVEYRAGPRALCRQRNLGIDRAKGDVVVFIDDDVWLEPDAFGPLLSALGEPGVVGATGKVLEPSPRRLGLTHSRLRRLLPGASRQGTMTPSGYPNRLWDLDLAGDVEVMHGCWMASTTELARELRFDEKLEEPGYAVLDDEEFAYRLSRHGRIRYVPTAVLEHRNTGFSSADARLFSRSVMRNRVYTYHKNFKQTPGTLAHFALIVALLFVHRALNGDRRGLIGLVDGLRLARRERTGWARA